MTDQDRHDIAAATGVPAHLLRGDTRAELEHHASQLADAGLTGPELTPDQIVDRATGRTTDVDDILDQALGR